MLVKVVFLFSLGVLRTGIVSWPKYDEEGRDTLRYHRALAQQTTVRRYKQETFEGIAVHWAGFSGSSFENGGAKPPWVVLDLEAQLEAASLTQLTLIIDNGLLQSRIRTVIERGHC